MSCPFLDNKECLEDGEYIKEKCERWDSRVEKGYKLCETYLETKKEEK